MFSLVTASLLGCGAVVALGATPAAAAIGSPTDLTTAGQACATEAPGPYLSPVRLNDADAVVLKGSYSGEPETAEQIADFQVWDITAPDERQQWRDGVDEDDHEVYIQLEDPSRQLDGVTYAWRVRVLDGDSASPWSGTCYFTVDRSGGAAPAVTSADYPPGGWDDAYGEVDLPGRFTFTSVSDDTVAYRYRFYSSEVSSDWDWIDVPAEPAGGPATVTWAPPGAGHNSLTVYAVDRAGNTSESAHYEFYVRETRPVIWSTAYPDWSTNLDYNVGVPGEFEFTANLPGTVSFAWYIDGDGPSGTVDAGSDGKATTMIAPTRAGRQNLYVQSVDGDGVKHPARRYEFVVDNAPKVTGDVDRGVVRGSSLRFHFAPRMPDVQAYLYWTRDYDGENADRKVTLPAGADGSADLTWTATNDNERTQAIYVQSRSADGTLSEPRYLSISVSDASPWVTRTGGDAIGSTATLKARTDMVEPTEYEIVVNQDESTRRVLPAAADGTVTFQHPVEKRGLTSVSVVARNAAGVRTGNGGTSWQVTDAPTAASADFLTGDGKIAPGTFTFTARQAGAVKYEYRIGGDYQTVEAGADGSATVNWTPPDSGYYSLYVSSVTAAGAKSYEAYYSFHIAPDPLTVTAVAQGSVLKGGVRTITITGTGLTEYDRITVTPASGPELTATVQSVSADHKVTTAEVDLTSAAEGRASVAVRPNDWSDAVTLANAFTITTPVTIRSVAGPAISGTAAVGSTVRASTGQWSPAGTAVTYQWSANGSAIDGATAATYVIPAPQLGKRLTVTVTATKAGLAPVPATSAATPPVAKGPASRTTAPPQITGTARVGGTVHASTGTWSPAADSYRYEWRVGGVPAATTAASLKLTAPMRGKTVTVTVTGVKAGHHDGRATSPAVTVQP
jgi:hypothetical protein